MADKAASSSMEWRAAGEKVKTHLHHVFPQEFFAEFEKVGINVDDYVMELAAEERIGKEGVHLKGDYNGRWQDFFADAQASGRAPTRADVEGHLSEILNDLGLANRRLGSLRTGEIKTAPATGVRGGTEVRVPAEEVVTRVPVAGSAPEDAIMAAACEGSLVGGTTGSLISRGLGNVAEIGVA